MMYGARDNAGMLSGVAALFIAMAAIVGGKYLAVELAFGKLDFEADLAKVSWRLAFDELFAITFVADAVIEEYAKAGKPLNFPDGANTQTPESEADFPKDAWADATQRWQAMSEEHKAAFRDQVTDRTRREVEAMTGDIKTAGFFESFSLFDILWFVLGGASAFKLGSGQGGKNWASGRQPRPSFATQPRFLGSHDTGGWKFVSPMDVDLPARLAPRTIFRSQAGVKRISQGVLPQQRAAPRSDTVSELLFS